MRNETRKSVVRCATGFLVALGSVAAEGVPAAAQATIDLTATDRPLRASFEEVYRVGSLAGASWETFGNVAGVAFDDSGNLYVFDRQSSTIIKIDPEGRLVRTIGTRGEGPGELRSPASFTVLHDGRVVVADIGHRAYTVFDPDGEFERSVSMNAGNVLQVGTLHPDPLGNGIISHLGANTMVAITRGAGSAPPSIPSGRPIERLDLSGSTAQATEIVQAWQPPRPDAPPPGAAQAGGMRMAMPGGGPRTFEPALHMGTMPDGGVAYADSSTWTLKVTGPDGGVERVIRRPLRPRPVTPAMEAAERARRLAQLEAGEGPRMSVVARGPGGGQQPIGQDALEGMMRGQIEQMQFYPEVPVIRDMATGWSGTLWVQRRGSEPAAPGPVDVVTAEGRYVGTFGAEELALPDAFGPDGLVAFIELGEYDVATVVVRRLPAALR